MNIRHEEIDSARSITGALGSQGMAKAARLAPLGLLALAILFALHASASVVAPMCAAIVVGVVLSRVGDRAHALGIPPFVTAALAVIVTSGALVLAGGALTSRATSLVDRAPELVARLSAAAAPVLRPLLALKTQIFGGGDHAAAASPPLDMAAVTGVLGGLTPALGGALIFLATLFFFVVGKAGLRRRIVLAPRGRDARLSTLRILNGVEEALAHYFGSATLVYGALAAFTAALSWMYGLGSPLLWGVFVFVACFVPFLGVALVTAALVVAGFAAHDGLLAGFAPAIIYMLAHLALENALLPAIVGRRFEINPFLVFVSIVFWTWMWGALGAVIASPMLLILKIVVEEFREVEKPELPD